MMTDVSTANSAAVLEEVVRRADDVVAAAEQAAQQAIHRARDAARIKADEAIQHLARVQEEAAQLESIALRVVQSAHADADATIAAARCEAAIIIDDSHQRSYEVTEAALEKAAELHEASHVASEELLAAAHLEAEEILAGARENAQRIIQDAKGQATGIDERVRESASFSAMWESAHEGSDIEDFFADMQERTADDVFRR